MYKCINMPMFVVGLACISTTIQSIQIKLENNTHVNLKITFNCAIYHRPTVVTIPSGHKGEAYLDDLTDKDITKDTTVTAEGAKLHPSSWTFRQIDLIQSMKLIFSTTDDNMFTLTVEKPSGAAYIQQPDGQ